MANVITLTDALNTAVAFEKATKRPEKGPLVISGATGGEGMTIEARIATLELQKRQNDGAGAGAGRGQGKLADEGCFYCGYVGTQNKSVESVKETKPEVSSKESHRLRQWTNRPRTLWRSATWRRTASWGWRIPT